jgi:threonine synthase
MRYISTRGGVEPVEFQQAVMMGLADDGGLLIPRSIPDVRAEMGRLRALGYNELAMEVIRLFATDLPEADLRDLVGRSYTGKFAPGVAPVVEVGGTFVLELFHGPTLSFKDVALQLLGNLFEYVLARGGGELNILGATSGDTGSAAIYGVRGRRGIRIFMMHPHGGVSIGQERQMTAVLDENVHNIAVVGSFDDCQRIMKTLAGDLEFKRAYSIGAVNSVNWARVLAQIVYYFAGTFEVQRRTGAAAVRVCVPTGNFGDVLAGWYAMRMGAPIGELVLATNENDILSRFFNSGEYSLGKVHRTLAPAMDIQVASNFERYLYYRAGQDAAALRGLMGDFAKTGALRVQPDRPGQVDAAFRAGSATRQQILDAIRSCHERTGYVLDPHTACGCSVAQRLGANDGLPVLCLATAHPAKFPEAIEMATGRGDLARHPEIDKLADMPTRCTFAPNDAEKVRGIIREQVGER